MTAVQQHPQGQGQVQGTGQAQAPGRAHRPSAGVPDAAPRTRRRVTVHRPSSTPPGRARLPLVPRSVAGRVRALTVLTLLSLAGLLAVTAAAVGDARAGLRVIGHDAGRQVVETGNLYFHLSTMDAQLANALLIGEGQNAGADRQDALRKYDRSRWAAGEALLNAARLADENPEKATARESLDALARYEQLAGRALLLSGDGRHSPAEVQRVYQQATDLMKRHLLPKAYNLTLDNGSLVRTTYQSKRDAVLVGQIGVVVLGLLTLGLLLALQIYLLARFRRVLNPALAAGSLLLAVLVAASTVMLAGQQGHMSRAKSDGFDSLLALWRVRGIGTNAHADVTRALLDPQHADTYGQVYLSKAQTLLFWKDDTNLTSYVEALQEDIGSSGDPTRKGRLGLLGSEADHTRLPGQREAYRTLLRNYLAFQRSDAQAWNLIREGQGGQAARTRLNGRSSQAFQAYDESLNALITIHDAALRDAVEKGDARTRLWNTVLPVAGLVLVVLVLGGVRPRLAEYR